MTYSPQVSVVWSTPQPAHVVASAASICHGRPAPTDPARVTALVRYLYQAGHRSVLEHVSLCMHIGHVSRSFLAHLTRHRMASYTVASQRYGGCDYDQLITSDDPRVREAARQAVVAYQLLINDGVPRDEARQVLPNAAAVSVYMTANARAWADIMRLRLCRRASLETRTWAQAAWAKLHDWFPALFDAVGPDCFETTCKQGRMRPDSCRTNT